MKYLWQAPTLDEAVYVTALALDREIDQVLINDVQEHFAQADKVLSMRRDGQLVGYMLLTFPLEGLVYIAGTMVVPPLHGNGIKAQATRVVMDTHPECLYWSGRTQSSIVWASVTRAATVMVPSPTSNRGDLQLLEVRDALATALGMNSWLHRGFYGGPLYGTKPTHREVAVQAWWDSLIDFQQGDALLYVARM